MKLTLTTGLVAVASAVVLAQAPSSSTGQNTSQGAANQGNRPAAGEQTLTGCLTSADNIYTLTVMNDSGAPGTTVETTAYTLAPGSGVDLHAHLNKRITVKGTDAGPDAQSSNRVVMNTPAAPAATGTSGRNGANGTTSSSPGSSTAGTNSSNPATANTSGSSGSGTTPMVETSAKARITQKTFNVTSVQPASGGCGA